MPWFKVDDHLHASRKAAKAGVAAMGLWVLAGSWSAAEELDGFVPGYMVARLGATQEAADALVFAGLWVLAEHDGEDGYRFHQWDEYQPTRAQLEAKREEARERMRRARARGGDVRANGEGTSRAVAPTPTRPDPKTNNTARKLADSDETTAAFEAFWRNYPRKIGKAAAAKAYARAAKTTRPDSIADGLSNAVAVWKATGTEERFIPHAATWLNQGRWADEHPTLTPEPTRPRTLMLCANQNPHAAHGWDHGRNACHCPGVEA